MRLTALGRLVVSLALTTLIVVVVLGVAFAPPGWWLK